MICLFISRFENLSLNGNKNNNLNNYQLTSESGISTSLPSSAAVSIEHLGKANTEEIKLKSQETSSFVLPQDSNCRQDDKSKSRYFPHFENKRTEKEEKDEKYCFSNINKNLNNISNENLKPNNFKTPGCGIRKRKISTQDENQHWNNRNVDKYINEHDNDNTSKRLKSCDNYESCVLTTAYDKICCLKQHQKSGVETFNENIFSATPSEFNPKHNTNSSNTQERYCHEFHTNFDYLFKNENRVSTPINCSFYKSKVF